MNKLIFITMAVLFAVALFACDDKEAEMSDVESINQPISDVNKTDQSVPEINKME